MSKFVVVYISAAGCVTMTRCAGTVYRIILQNITIFIMDIEQKIIN